MNSNALRWGATGVSLLAGGAIFLASGAASAQQRSAGAQAMLEEVVVTARRREESLEDLPLSIAAITADQMQTQGLYTVEDISRTVPNVTLVTSDRANNTRVVIRGIGGGAPDPVEVFGSGMYIDGHYIPNSQGGFMNTVDIERIELLRGPQGTLFGKNVTGGAVNIISAKPGPDFASSFTLRAADHGQQDVRGMVNFPISDTIFARFSVAHEQMDGYYYNRNLNVDTGGTEVSAATAAFRFTPGNWTVDVSGTVNQRDDDNRGGQCSVGDGLAPQWGGGTGHVNRIYDGALADFQASCESDVAAGTFITSQDKLTWSKVDTEGLFVAAQWDSDGAVGNLDSASFRMNASTRHFQYTYLQDRDFNEFAIDAIGSVGEGAQNWTDGVELIFEAEVNDRLQFTVGSNWFKERHYDGTNECFLAMAAIGGANADPNSVAQCANDGLHFELLPLPRENTGGPGPFMSNKSVWNDSIGVFGHVTYALNDNWDLDFGARYTRDKRAFNNIEWPSVGCDVGATVGGITDMCDNFTAPLTYDAVINNGFFNQASATFDATTPMISFTRNLAPGDRLDSGNVYFLYSEGFLTGGFNTEINSNLPDTASLLTYQPEEVSNYEVGFKGTLNGGNMRIAAAIFYMDYRDKQDDIEISNPDGLYGIDDPLGLRTNVAQVDISGIEFELRMVPWDGGFLSVDLGYLKNEFGEYSYIDPEDPNNVIDNSNQGVADLSPEWTLNIGLEHEFQLANGATLTPRISVYGQDDYEWLTADRTKDAPPSFCNQESYFKWGTRLTYAPSQGNWQASIFGNNITDEKIYEMCNATRTIYVYRHERPAWWGAEFTMRFGDN